MTEDAKNPGNEVEILVRARYPIVYFVTPEEERALGVLSEVATKVSKKLMVWSATRGLREYTVGKDGAKTVSKSEDQESRDPMIVIEKIMNVNEPGLFVLLDYHAFINEPLCIRALRDAVSNLVNTQKSIIILSPVFKLPIELQKEIAVVDMPLPNAEQITEIIERVEKSVKGKGKPPLETPTNGDREKLVKACCGLTEFEVENALAKSVVKEKKFSIDIILNEKEQIVRKSGILEFYQGVGNMDDVGGIDGLKTWLAQRQKAFSNKAVKYQLEAPRGVLLVGVQGCGKSLTAKAVPGLWRLPLLRLDAGRLFTREVGGSESLIRDMIKFAENVAPCVLWIDEIEKGFAGVQSSTYSDAGTTARVFATLITWLNEKKKSVFVIATANNIGQLPPELLRKGRFDEIFFVDLPNRADREDIFGIHLRKRGRDPKKFDVKALAGRSKNFSGAEIEQSIIAAMYTAFYDEEREFTTDDVLAALLETVPLSTTMGEQINQTREWAKTRARFASTRVTTEEADTKSRFDGLATGEKKNKIL